MDSTELIKQYQLPLEFPNKVLDQAERIEEKISEEEIANRIDLREMKTFTIDGADAKDFDDAVSIEKMKNGNFKLGVHIADVSHYVTENSSMDKEALKRGNSVYLVDRVIPMLPEKLSNGICSLKPGEPRLTLSILMEIDNNGKVVNHEIVESVIKSNERLVYDDISELLEKDDENLRVKYNHIYEELKLMEELCYILTEKRDKRGSLDFDFPEAIIVLDDNGVPRSEEHSLNSSH